MKRKRPLLKAAALLLLSICLGASPALAQSNVYSLNVVGYVNLAMTNGYNFVTQPLDYDGTGTNNALNNALMYVPDQTRAYVWDVPRQQFLPPSTYSIATTNWDIDYDVSPGKGFVIYTPSNWVCTVVGNVLQGTLTTFVAGNNKRSLLASKVPIMRTISGWDSLGFQGTDGDNVLLFSNPSQSFGEPFTYLGGVGWYRPDHACGPDGPTLEVGQPFFVQHPGTDKNWTITFWVQRPAQMKQLSSPGGTAPTISRIGLRSGVVTLTILNPGGGPYAVQFSTDGVTWSTVTTGQTGAVWTGPSPGALEAIIR